MPDLYPEIEPYAQGMLEVAGGDLVYWEVCGNPRGKPAVVLRGLQAALSGRLAGDVLEIACGTGLVTRRLRERIDPARRLVASDISPAMLDYARNKLVDCKGIEWREADAASLPFDASEFSAVVYAFGVMFVPDKRAVFREVRRVLKSGGTFLFNVWDRIEENPASAINAEIIEGLFPGDAEVRFRTPYEMHDPAALRQLLFAAGFREERIERKRIQIDGVSARTIALGQIRGTPRSLLIEKRGASLDDVVEKVAAALARMGGADPWRGAANAVVVEARAGA
jgi:ubiquinone/menaquinone biosynthesis C-methylase UbiE